ncbi:MAG: enoyl-CoA hydratase/isomerase family protein [Trueperaceae bacterium]|nr:enoyl-CoA hydratase/isomerase family protein [Trueperaceae bacterium]
MRGNNVSDEIDNMEEDAGFEFEHIRFELEDSVAVITIDRQAALNALNQDVLMELSIAFEVAQADSSVRALVLTGAGRAFIAGADISELQTIEDAFAGREASLAGQDVANSLASLPFPTVAAINGFALGGGLELALAADLRVASTGARLGLPEVGLGLIPGYGGTQRLPRLIGQGRALDLILTGRHVNAEEALQLGLVNRVADDALGAALELARTAARNAPIALGLAKEAVVRGLDVTLAQGLEIEADLFGMVATTDDMREGTAAFLEKRAADFSGQ